MGGEFRGNRQMTGNDFVDRIFNAGNIFFSRRLWKGEIEFAFFPFDVGRYRPSASEKIHHRAVDDVFAGMHGRIFLLVVFVKLSGLFHNSFDLATKIQNGRIYVDFL